MAFPIDKTDKYDDEHELKAQGAINNKMVAAGKATSTFHNYWRHREAMAALLHWMMLHVDEFQQRVLGLPCAPCALPPHRRDFKVGHMREEIDEYLKAYFEGDFEGQVDALVDLVYVALGALLEMKVDPGQAFDIVNQANLLKMRGETKRGEAYDAVKPPGWRPPDHAAMLARLAFNALISPAFLEGTRIREERGARYNQGTVKRADHFPFGNLGHLQINWIKMIRLRSEVESGVGTPAALSEHIVDLINYLSFWWEELNGGIR